MIILDTNVISEMMKPEPDSNVDAWLANQPPELVYTTAVTAAEIRSGIEILPAGNRRHSLQTAADRLLAGLFAGRILPFDEPAAPDYAEIVARRRALGLPAGAFDALIAAIARHHGAVLATRDTQDFAHCGIRLVNPWSAPAKRR
ncbi:MAG: type II toxin-antitoxin system VapC family toxin [Bryobacteraceae bacterium]|nr:type II toxin-antitoxin system VapC family toxin [Bryobacteraceae bacterium]